MYLAGILIRNWMCYAGENRIDGLPPGPIAVVAQYVENARRSNWGGKTALLEAVRFAITGQHRKRTDDACITHGADGMEVGLRFDTGLEVTRTRPRGGPTVLRVVDPVNAPGLVMEREAAEQHLVRVLRVSPEDLENTNWIGQGDTEALVGQTSGARRAVVSRWLELDLWERLGVAASRRSREATTALEIARRATKEPDPRALEAIDEDLARTTARAKEIDAEVAEIDGRLSKYSTLGKIAALRTELESVSTSGRELRAELTALPRLDEEAIAEERRDLERARFDLSEAEKEQQEARSLLGGSFDGTCPVTCNACPVADDIRGERAAFTEKLSAARARSVAASAKVREHLEVVRNADEVTRTRDRLVHRLNDAIARARETKRRLDAAEAEAKAANLALDSGEIANLRARRTALQEERSTIAEERGRLTEERRSAVTFAARNEARERAIADAEKAARVAALTARALGSAGIPARIAAESLRGLEERANSLLAGSGLSFSLAWERELADPSPTCLECGHVYEKRKREKACPSCGAARARKRSDELDILVDDGSGDVEDARAKSGGAKVLVACAIRLAGGMMLRERRGAPLDVAFVDEPFGPLDAENRETLARTFAGLLSSVGLQQALVVSHDATLLEALPARIVVTREGSSSRLTLEV
jgi:DNA repair exonuclease SbcCD ATPase subunit